MPRARELRLQGPYCELLLSEYDAEPPDGEGSSGVLLCPPHPAFGGTREDVRLRLTAGQLSSAGITAWCLDYSGYHRGSREVAEVVSALEQLAPRVPRLGLMGYSYGAVVASLAARRTTVPLTALALLAPPLAVDTMLTDISAPCPKLFVCGLDDTIAPVEAVRRLFAKAEGEKECRSFDDSHFFELTTAEVAQAIASFFVRYTQPRRGAGR